MTGEGAAPPYRSSGPLLLPLRTEPLPARRYLVNTLDDALLERIFCNVCFRERCSRPLRLPPPTPTPPPAASVLVGAVCIRCTHPRFAPIVVKRLLPVHRHTVTSARHLSTPDCVCRLLVLPRVCTRWSRILQQPDTAWQHMDIDLNRPRKHDNDDVHQQFDACVVAPCFSR